MDAVEIVARLLGGDGEPRLVNQALEIGGRQLKLNRQLAFADDRKILARQARQRELRASGAQAEPLPFAILRELDLSAVRQLAHDVVQHMRGRRGAAAALDLGRHAHAQRKIEICRGETETALGGYELDVRQKRDSVSPLNDTLDVS